MKKLVLRSMCIMAALLLIATLFSFGNIEAVKEKPVSLETPVVEKTNLFTNLHLKNLGLSEQAFQYALKGYNYLISAGKIQNDGILSIIDFSLPSSEKRLFVIDLKKCALLFNTYVSHGRNSGKEMANEFSNAPQSFKSSLGFYLTSNTYFGKHGYSLRLEGEEAGINDNALDRGIVMHSASYVNENIIQKQGYIGRSEGCPAVPESIYKPIIEKIKNKSCLFIYSPDKNYFSHSPILNGIAFI
jgi:hypothetical protein